MARDLENRAFAEPEIVESPLSLGSLSPQMAQNQLAVPQQTAVPSAIDYGNYDFGNFDLSAFSQPSTAAAAPMYSQPTAQPVQTAPYYGDYGNYDFGNFDLGAFSQPSAAATAPMYSQPTAQPVQTAPYYGGYGDYGFDPYNIGNFGASPSTAAIYSPPATQPVQTTSYQQPQVSGDWTDFLNSPEGQAYAANTGYQMGALPAAQAGATPAEISASSPPPGTTWGVYSDPNDPMSQYTVKFAGDKSMPLTVSKDTPVFLYDNKTKQVLASGIGPEGANAVAAAVYKMNTDPNSKNEWWDIYTGPAGATDPSQFTSVVTDPRNKNFGQRFLDAAGTLLPLAVSFIPGLGQASLLTKVAAGAAAGAGGAALKGQDILKGGLIGGATAGVMGAKVLPGHQNLSGVLGKALESVPVVGGALKTVSGALTKGTSTWNPVEGGVVTATKSAAPALLSGGLSSLASSQLNKALDLAQRYPGTTNYADQVYGKEPSVEDQFDDILVKGRRVSELAPAASGAAQTVVPTFAAPEYVDTRTIEVKKRNEPLNLEAPVSTITQFAAPENIDPNEIVVKNKYQPRTLDEIAAGTVSSLLPSLLNNAAAPSTTPQKKDSTKSTIGKIVGGLTIADALAKIISKLAGGGSGGTSPGGQQLQSVFSAKLPRASGIFAPENLAPRDMSGIDYYRYGFGPEAAFFRNVPTSAAERTALTNAYRPSQLSLSGTGGAASSVYDPAAMLNQLSAELMAAGVSDADFNAYLQTQGGQQALGASPASASASPATTSAAASTPSFTPTRALSPAQQLYASKLAAMQGQGTPDQISDYVAGLSDYQALASLANYDNILGSKIYNGTDGARTIRELQDWYGTPIRAAARGGSMGYSRGSSNKSFAVQGPGTGRSDEIPAVLSDGEYVIDAETVALLGDGSSKAGAKKLDEFRVNVRKHKGRNLAKGKFSVNAKRPEKYLSGGRT